MNRIPRCLGVLAALGGTLLTLAVAAPAALATIPDPGGGPGAGPQPAVHTVVTGGMPGWQITLITAGAALAAAIAAVLLDRAWAARRSGAHEAGLAARQSVTAQADKLKNAPGTIPWTMRSSARRQ